MFMSPSFLGDEPEANAVGAVGLHERSAERHDDAEGRPRRRRRLAGRRHGRRVRIADLVPPPSANLAKQNLCGKFATFCARL